MIIHKYRIYFLFHSNFHVKFTHLWYNPVKKLINFKGLKAILKKWVEYLINLKNVEIRYIFHNLFNIIPKKYL